MVNVQNRLKFVSPEVVYSDGEFLAVDHAMISMLKEKALVAPRRRCRLCFHSDPDAAQHEMLIVMHNTSYVCPHRHLGKVETLSVIEGMCDVITFDPAGKVTDVVSMSSPGNGGCFFYRMPQGVFHTLIFRSQWLAFVETTIGPFDRAKSEVADWAPPESEAAAGRLYLSNIDLSR
jgi:cupin fold WbuC family metalloprotein